MKIPSASAPSDSRTLLGVWFFYGFASLGSVQEGSGGPWYSRGGISRSWLTGDGNVPQMSHRCPTSRDKSPGLRSLLPLPEGSPSTVSPFPRCFHGLRIPGHWGRTKGTAQSLSRRAGNVFNKCRSTPGGIQQFPAPLEALSRHGLAWQVCHSPGAPSP